MSILTDIVNMRGALQQQKLASSLDPLQIQQAQTQLQMLQQQAPQVAAILNGIYGGGAQSAPPPQSAGTQQPPAQSQGLLPQTTQSPTGPVTTFPLAPNQAQPQPPAGALPGLLHGAIGAVNAAQPGGGLLPAPQQGGGLLSAAPQSAPPQQPQAPQQPPQQQGPDPWQLISAGTRLQGTMLPQWQQQGKAMVAQGQAILANNPQYVTQRAVAANQLTQDQAATQQAQQTGSQLQQRAALMKYLTDSKLVVPSNNGGAASLFGGITPGMIGMSGVNPQQGLQFANGVESAIPGAPQAQAALEGARATAEAQGAATGKTIELTAPPGSPYAGQKYTVPLDQFLASQRGAAAPPGTPPGVAGSANVAELSPQQESALRGRGTQSADYVTTLQKAADDATTSNYALDNVVQSARGATLGPGAPAREFVEKGFTALAQTLDPSFTPPAELGSYQELSKYGNQLGFASAKAMGSREAAQIVNMAIASNPNKELTPQAFGWIANSMKAMNNYVIAKNEAVQGADKQAPGAAQQAAATWNTNVSPQAWDLSLDAGMAAQLAPKLGPDKIASSLPFMASADAVSAFRNIPASMRAAVLAKLPPQAKQELAQGLRQ